MIYLTPPTTHVVKVLAKKRRLGGIVTPDSDRPALYKLSTFSSWAADNGCFAAGDRFDPDRYIHWLQGLRREQGNCLFATAPDVVGCHRSTWARSRDWLGLIRCLGYKAAFVAQDGLDTDVRLMWSLFDVLFIGGTTEFKMGPAARRLINEAQDRGKWVHVGRVNSATRYRHFRKLGVDSVDGTFICFGPDKNIPIVLSWIGEQ